MKKYYKKNFKELNLLQAKAFHQKSKYKKINKYFTKENSSKEETVILYDTSDSDSSSSIEYKNSPDEAEKPSIAYVS